MSQLKAEIARLDKKHKTKPYVTYKKKPHLKYKDTYRLNVKGWKKIYLANTYVKKTMVITLISNFLSEQRTLPCRIFFGC